MIGEAGRRADFVVVARPAADDEEPTRRTFRATLFRTERPVLVVPPGQVPVFGRRVAIAWKDDTRAAKAVLPALRCLARAERLHVLAGVRQGAGRLPCPRSSDFVAADPAQHPQSQYQEHRGLHRQGQDCVAGGQGFRAGHDAADGGEIAVGGRATSPSSIRSPVGMSAAGRHHRTAERTPPRSPASSACRRSSTSSSKSRASAPCSIPPRCSAGRTPLPWRGPRPSSATRTPRSTRRWSRAFQEATEMLNKDVKPAAQYWIETSSRN